MILTTEETKDTEIVDSDLYFLPNGSCLAGGGELISRKTGITLLAAVIAVVALVFLLLPRIPQPQAYHHFADRRSFLGIPNFGDVVSNLPFAVVGLWGLLFVLRLKPDDKRFLDSRKRWPYLLVFAGLLLTAFGSAYYHLAPNNARLVWDRVPITVVFMSMVAAVIVERISVRAGLWLLPALLALGSGSVLQWYSSELHGTGDLAFLRGGAGMLGARVADGAVLAASLHPGIRPGGGGRVLCPGEIAGDLRSDNLPHPRRRRKWPHAQAPGGGDGWVLDPEDGDEESTRFNLSRGGEGQVRRL